LFVGVAGVAVVVAERMVVVPEVAIVWGSALLRGRMSYLPH
jgi:hypothetical protein